ncbi:MAG: T9SS type A sorting domain-containing protein [Bacteroidota bacterium]
MKLLTPLLFFTCFVFTQSGNAQNIVTVPTTTAVSCDGKAYIDDTLALSSWYWTDNAGNTIQNGSDTLNNLCTGTYILNFTTILLGTGADTFDIIQNPCSSFSVNIVYTIPAAGNLCDGDLQAEFLNGAAPFQFEIAPASDPLNPMIIILPNPDVMVAEVLCAETYLITVTDSNGCIVTTSAVIGDACAGFSLDITSVQNASAPNVCDGSISVNGIGGTPAYTYQWSNGVTTPSLTNLCAGSYSVMVTDAMGCWDSIAIPISDPCSNFMVYLSGTANTDPVNCNGTVTSAVYGGSGPYVYSWSNGVTTNSLSSVCSGIYSITVTDMNGCMVTANFSITDSIPGAAQITADLFPFDETSSGACDGAAVVNNVIGGMPPYTYLHSDGQTTSTATNLCAGIYDVVITDNAGNSTTLPYVIADPGNIIFNLPYPDSTIIDSLFNNAVANCDIDYNTVNAAYIYNASLAGFDSVTVTWIVTDSIGVNYITETYYFGGGNGVYSLSLSVYCPLKSVARYLKVYDQLYLSEELSIEESALNNLIVYPNPFNESITIQFEEPGDYALELVDLTGRSILTHHVSAQNVATINGLTHLAKGEYILRIHSATESVILKMIK